MANRKKISSKKIELHLLNYLNDINVFESKKFFDVLPDFISDNLKHDLREYQKQALQNFDLVEHMDGADSIYNQLMFYMATGSGKTDVMAAIILYMYAEFGYQYFLFTVSSSAVVEKTRLNLINDSSFKYLFNDPININGNHVQIKEVQTYPDYPEDGMIYIRLASVQTLSSEIYTPRENGLTLEDFDKHKMIILADEAHHFNVGTRSKSKNKISKDWEGLLDLIRGRNPKNRQFEFTATIDLHNKEIYEKYQNKIVFQYDLSDLIEQGYSKEVYKLQANNDDYAKILNAILLSQFRKRIAHNIGIQDFKPVILFKSNKIDTSNKAENKFLSIINELNADKLNDFIHKQYNSTQSDALMLTYKYWLNQNLAEAVVELRNDFKKETELNANDSTSKGILENSDTFNLLNTIDTPDSPIRVVFAVAKLNEGWDVLNLYDIVRINENGTSINETNAEAQLIGRGARYDPFIYNHHNSYTRRFDSSNPEKQLLERLYYHTINDPKYLDNLEKSLDAIDLPVNDDKQHVTLSANVKKSFKKSRAYNRENIYYNKVEKIPLDYYDSIIKYGIDVNSSDPIDMVDATLESKYDKEIGSDSSNTTVIEVAAFNNVRDSALIRTGMQRNKFFRFNSIHKYCPTVKSMYEFISSTDWLGDAKIQARIAVGTAVDNISLDSFQKLKAVDKYLIRIENNIKKNFNRSKGTNIFLPIPIKKIVQDYTKRVPISFNNKDTQAIIDSKDMTNQDWYVYDNAIVDGLEASFVDQINSRIPDLKSKYGEYYLIRIDERTNDFKLHDFGDGVTHYNGYMPDFILYLQNKDYIYQVYMEPKGDNLLERDQWKQDLLERINPKNIEIIGENDEVKLYGVKFYITNDRRHMFKELGDIGILPKKD